MIDTLKHFKASIFVTIVCLVLSFIWGLNHGAEAGLGLAVKYLFIAVMLGVCEITLSIDNAIYNAKILKHWSPFWTKMFLTVGIIVAVFGVRLVLPAFAVSVTASMSLIDTFKLALNNPTEYTTILKEHHYLMSAFGGMFLLMLFLSFFFDKEKELFWFEKFEKVGTWLANTSKGMKYLVAFAALAFTSQFLPIEKQADFFMAGLYGVGTYAILHLVGAALEYFGGDPDEATATGKAVTGVAKGGIIGFLYLEFIDLSFSGDSLFAGLAVTNDIILLMLGLAIGAMVVRCTTVYLVKQGTLDVYQYLEHGAMYAIAALSVIMLSSTFVHLPEIVIGAISVGLIGLAIRSSIKLNKLQGVE